MPEPNTDVDTWPPAPQTGHPLFEYDGTLSGMMAELSAARVPPSVSLLARGLHKRDGLDLKTSAAYARSFSARHHPALIVEQKRAIWVLAPSGVNIFLIPLVFWLSNPTHLRVGPFHLSQWQRISLHDGMQNAAVITCLVQLVFVLYLNHVSRRYTRRVRQFNW